MIPYIELPDLGPLHWFGILVATAVMLGIHLAHKRAPLYGIDNQTLESFIFWLLSGGFIFAHIFDQIFYYPQQVLERPWELLFIWQSMSSIGGFIGAFMGMMLWKKFRGKGQSMLPFADLILSVFPVAWIFGRMGCAVAHDHPGILTSSWLGVKYPGGTRYDLGFLEMLYALAVSLLIVIPSWRKHFKVGTYVAMISLLYAPVRFGLDFLRLREGDGSDVRYANLTPAQWACIGLFFFGLYWLARLPKLALPPPQSIDAPKTAPGKAKRKRL